MDLTGNTFVEGPAGKLEAILKEPKGTVTRAAVCCHPHPLFGGTMHNKVVYRIAKAFQEAGFAVLRFNFRGTGRSQGTHDEGRGEQDDLRAALRYVEQRYPEAEIWLAGFSFGSVVSVRVGCADKRVRALVAAGFPVSKYNLESAPPCDKPRLFVQGSLDEFGTQPDIQRFFASMSEPKSLKIIEGGDHFFEGHLDELARAVSDFIASVESKP
ncbi:MAG TPA: alpha/beta fold hydrolase [Blastocatellia bacterium]|nr:alpha/beta fold hydrolase [Blastocatellia bacterium]